MNVQDLYGLLNAVGFFICVAIAFSVGYRLGGINRQPPPAKEVDTDEQRRAKRLYEGFQQLMSYDVTTATKGKG